MPDESVKDKVPLGFSIRHTFRGEGTVTTRIAWSPDGLLLASVGSDDIILLWNAEAGGLYRALMQHSDVLTSQWVKGIAWSPDGTTIASGSIDGTILLWDAVTGRLTRTLEGHTGYVTSVSFSFDGRLLASKSSDHTVRLWRSDTWENVSSLYEIASGYLFSSLSFHPKAPVLATAESGRRAWVGDWRTGSSRSILLPTGSSSGS